MLERLETILKREAELSKILSDPDVIGDQRVFREYAKQYAEISEIASHYRDYKRTLAELEEAREMLVGEDDGELREFIKEDITRLEGQKEKQESDLKVLLLPKDPSDDKNILLEIRAGAGGEEASLFASDLFRMYAMYAERKGFSIEILSSHPTGLGGYKEIIALIAGKGAYSLLKYESGVHRVQRIPETEGGGRIHTSTATVAVLPEAEEIDVDIQPDDLRIEVMRSSGPGGQSVNTTDSAVRITHVPSEIVVSCQDEKSQHKNKAKAMKILRARLFEREQRKQMEEISKMRKSQVGTGDRSERIRTYNFPKNRVSDHRIGLTLYNLPDVLSGELDEVIDNLVTYYQTEMLKQAK
ncbi:MAG: peptide chain release factor 1 [Deltaproteobacteria bacterium]|nr:peptide chain release factor 1 [Deltaproteobacteria bacterium]NIS78544.1 peptide chain release factor 1 [Deltaproteobacteria bacterium]